MSTDLAHMPLARPAAGPDTSTMLPADISYFEYNISSVDHIMILNCSNAIYSILIPEYSIISIHGQINTSKYPFRITVRKTVFHTLCCLPEDHGPKRFAKASLFINHQLFLPMKERKIRYNVRTDRTGRLECESVSERRISIKLPPEFISRLTIPLQCSAIPLPATTRIR